MFELDNDAEAMRCINGGEPISLDEIQAQHMPYFLDFSEHDCFGFWIVENLTLRTTDNSEPIGWVSLRPRAEPNLADLGQGICHRSHGYRNEAWVY